MVHTKIKTTIAAAPKRTSWRASKLEYPRIVMGAPTLRTVHPVGLLGNPFAKIFVGWREQSNVQHNQ